MDKKIHFIGICGVAMSALALAFKKQGWRVTGSDVGFFPPISTHLQDADVNFYPGWHPEKMVNCHSEQREESLLANERDPSVVSLTQDDKTCVPDLVVVGNVASSSNPEWLYTQEHKLNYKSYPEVIAEYFVKPNSIVCAGTYGKSTSTALLTWILKEAGFNPSYMFGGLMAPPPFQGGVRGGLPSAEMTTGEWSVLEGDEYKSSRWDNGPKFAHYSPTHLLLTSVVWDHADVYPTEDDYIKAFEKLIAAIPKNGAIIISEQAYAVILSRAKDPSHHWITYGKNPTNDYVYTNIVQSKNGIEFTITEKISNIKYQISSGCLGEYMADNITGCFALAKTIGVPTEKIISAIKSFKGMKRRLEKRYEGNITIFDDIAHSPTKAKSILETLKKIYTGKIFAVFEPNSGNRRPEAAAGYDNNFAAADEVIIPRLTKIKFDLSELEPPFDGDELARVIGATQPNVKYIEDDEKLLNYLQQKIQPGDVVVFMGSHGFRGMIEQLLAFIRHFR